VKNIEKPTNIYNLNKKSIAEISPKYRRSFDENAKCLAEK